MELSHNHHQEGCGNEKAPLLRGLTRENGRLLTRGSRRDCSLFDSNFKRPNGQAVTAVQDFPLDLYAVHEYPVRTVVILNHQHPAPERERTMIPADTGVIHADFAVKKPPKGRETILKSK
jgi:hypothetical protein